MITYEFRLYDSKRVVHLDNILKECCFIWNHCLALQKRYYKFTKAITGKGEYISGYSMANHIAKRYKTTYIGSQSRQEIIERLDMSYMRFFKGLSRPPKFKKTKHFSSFLFKSGVGYKLENNEFTLRKGRSRRGKDIVFKFCNPRTMIGKIKTVRVKRDCRNKYWLYVVTDGSLVDQYINRKTHNGASLCGIDFGLNTYLTVFSENFDFLNETTTCGEEFYKNPQYLKRSLRELRKISREYSLAKNGSSKKNRLHKRLGKLYSKLTNLRNDFQWKLSHELCQKYNQIFIEDLDLRQFSKKKYWGRKVGDLAHGEFLKKLEHVCTKYGTGLRKIDRYYPSSKTCNACGNVNNNLQLSDRSWVCPICKVVHPDRDLLAANNILRKGISELS